MKIVVDKIKSEPKHSLSKQELKFILEKLSKTSQEIKKTFKLSAQLFSSSGWDRPVICNNYTYNILSRGVEKEKIIKELLIEIFSNETKISYETYAHKLNTQQRKKLEKLITPYFDEIINEIK